MATNYDLMGNIAGGIREAMLQYNDMADRKKQQGLLALSAGVEQKPDGTWGYTQQKQKQVDLENLKTSDESQNFDVGSEKSQRGMGLLKSLYPKENLPNMSYKEQQDYKGLLEQREKSKGMTSLMGQRVFNTHDNQTQRLHEQFTKDILDNPMANQLLTTAQNLDNAYKNFMLGGRTPAEFAELQQSLRSNMGIKGTSGVDERGETYWKSIGLSGAKAKQYLFGTPEDVMKADPEAVDNVLKVMEVEKQNKINQASDQMKKQAARHKSWYARPDHADLRGDLNDAMELHLQQFQKESAGPGLIRGGQGSQASQPQTQAPGGATGKAASVNDPDVQAYAKKHNISPQKALEFKMQYGG